MARFTVSEEIMRWRRPLGYVKNPTWKNVKVGDRVRLSFYSNEVCPTLLTKDCTVVLVNPENGILALADGEERDFPLCWRDVMNLEWIKEG